MSSVVLGECILPVEVSNISPHGLWLLLGDAELFASFSEFPRFRDAKQSVWATAQRILRVACTEFVRSGFRAAAAGNAEFQLSERAPLVS
jgi:hypothetical protein